MAYLEFNIDSAVVQSPALDKECGDPVGVYFVPGQNEQLVDQTAEPFVPVVGDWVVSTWEIFGPEDSGLAAFGNVVADSGPFPVNGTLGNVADPLSFTPPLPGRYLVRLVAHRYDQGAGGPESQPAETFSALYEVLDPQIPRASIIATNEKTEYHTVEGWSRSVELYLSAVSKIYGGRQFLTATNAGGVGLAQGDVVTLVTENLSTLWRDAETGSSSYNNYVMNIAEADLAGSGLVGPLYLALEAVPDSVRSSFLMKGLFVMDTSTAILGELIYLGPNDANGGSLITETEATANNIVDTNLRPVGYVMHNAAVTASPPGLIHFDGTAEVFSTRLITKLGLSIMPTTQGNPSGANPGLATKWAKNTIWVDSTNSDQLMYGNAAVDSGGSSGSATYVQIDPVDDLNGYSVDVNDFLIGVNCQTGIATSAHMSINLPPVANVGTGHRIVIKDETGFCGNAAFDAAGGGIKIIASGQEVIDGEGILWLNVPFASASIYCTGTGWSIY